MTRHLDYRHHRVRIRLAQQIDRISNVIRPSQRRGRLQQDDDVRRPTTAQHFVKGMLDDRQHRRVVSGKRRGAHERHFQSGTPARLSDLRRIRAENHAIDHAGFARRPRRVLEQRPTRQRPHVLSGNALRASAGWNDPKHHTGCHSGHDSSGAPAGLSSSTARTTSPAPVSIARQ
jgi:hypothetical protein